MIEPPFAIGMAYVAGFVFGVGLMALIVAHGEREEQPKPEHYSDRWEAENNE